MDNNEDLLEVAKEIEYGFELPETLDPIPLSYEATPYPSGTLIISRNSCFPVLYHANDNHVHSCILLWYSTDGSDKLYKKYEAGITKPFILELGSYLTYPNFYVFLNELGHMIRTEECAYVPRDEVVEHPRFTETLDRLVKAMMFLHTSNNANYSFKHKWQPNIWIRPENNGYSSIREYYNDLRNDPNPFASSFRNPRRVSAVCVDVVMLLISLLHEELFINLTENEITEGKTPDLKRILVDDHHYDVSRLIRPSSDLYRMYQRDPHPFIKGRHVIKQENSKEYFFVLPYVISAIAFFTITFTLKKLLKLSYFP